MSSVDTARKFAEAVTPILEGSGLHLTLVGENLESLALQRLPDTRYDHNTASLSANVGEALMYTGSYLPAAACYRLAFESLSDRPNQTGFTEVFQIAYGSAYIRALQMEVFEHGLAGTRRTPNVCEITPAKRHWLEQQVPVLKKVKKLLGSYPRQVPAGEIPMAGRYFLASSGIFAGFLINQFRPAAL